MAKLDTKRDEVIIRVVYDGPPAAGKTASVYALKEIFKTADEVYAVETGEKGETTWFEWYEYRGGKFVSRPIVCQIVSVPGRPALSARRRKLLESADAVVFVADSRSAHIALGLEYLREARNILQQADPDRPVPLVIQANRRDAADALDEDALELFLPDDVNAIPSVATQQKGVRDALVFAISLAVGRLRRLIANGVDLSGEIEIDSPEALLQQLQEIREDEPDAAASVLETLLDPATADTPDTAVRAARTVDADSAETPALPDVDTPAHLVFPSRHGRAMLAQIEALGLTPLRRPDGAWEARDQTAGWRCFSRADWCYASEADAARALRAHVQAYVHFSPMLSEQRLAAAAPCGDGRWRIWQIAFAAATLSQFLQQALTRENIEDFARDVYTCTRRIHLAHEMFARYAPHLPITLESLSADEIPAYVGLLDVENRKTAASAQDFAEYVRAILADPIGFALADNQFDPAAVLELMRNFEPQDAAATAVLEELFFSLHRSAVV